MERQFNHEKLDVYRYSLEFIRWGHELGGQMNASLESVDHFCRASTSIPTNIVIGNSKESPRNRVRSFDISYASMLECAACIDVLQIHGSIAPDRAEEGKRMLSRLVAMIIGLRRRQIDRVKQDRSEYTASAGNPPKFWFYHERLDVYRFSLKFIQWFIEFSNRQDIAGKSSHDLDRCSTGIPLNIAEGNGKFTYRDRCKFLGYAETHTLCCAKELDLLVIKDLVQSNTVLDGKEKLYRIESMIRGLRRSLQNREREL